MKKIFLAFMMLLFVSSVLATEQTYLGMFPVSENSDRYDVSVKVEKGWNLILGAGILSDLNGGYFKQGDIQLSNIKSIWIFLPKTQEYAQVFPNIESDKFASYDDDELISTPVFVYSNKAGVLNFKSEPVIKLDQLPLYAGWNFVGITPEFNGRKFEDIFANCDVEKAYFYNNKVYEGHSEPSWERVFPSTTFSQNGMDERKSIEGLGMVVKVSQACHMIGASNPENQPPRIDLPPQLPKDTRSTPSTGGSGSSGSSSSGNFKMMYTLEANECEEIYLVENYGYKFNDLGIATFNVEPNKDSMRLFVYGEGLKYDEYIKDVSDFSKEFSPSKHLGTYTLNIYDLVEGYYGVDKNLDGVKAKVCYFYPDSTVIS